MLYKGTCGSLLLLASEVIFIDCDVQSKQNKDNAQLYDMAQLPNELLHEGMLCYMHLFHLIRQPYSPIGDSVEQC